MQYTDDQVRQALRESMDQGFSLEDSLRGAADKFGVQQDQLDRAKTDIVGNLQNAGLKESPVTLIQQLSKTNPDFTKGFDFSNVGRMGDESTGVIQAPSTNLGGYNVKALAEFADVGEGSYAPTGKLGGYEATKTDTQSNGKPLISTFKYDSNGALTSSTVRSYEGSDSGTEYILDAAGKVIGSSKFDDSEAWKGTALSLLPMATMAFGVPLGELLGGGALGAAGSGALFSGTGAALAGKEGSDLLKSALVGGATSAVGAGLGATAGRAAGEFAGNLFTDPDLASLAAQTTRGAVEGGIKSLPGAIATGDTGRLKTGVLTGGAMGAATSLAGDTQLPFTKQQAEAAINLTRAIQSGNMTSAVNSAATLINNPDITVATRAATLLKAINSGNPNAILAATQMLGNAVGRTGGATSTKVAEAPGGAFETSAIIEPGDMGGTLVPGEAGEDYIDPNRVYVTGQGAPVDLLSLLDVDTVSAGLPTNRADQKVEVEAPRSREDIALDYFFYPDDLGESTVPAGQKVDVVGRTLPPQSVDVIGLFDRDLGTEQVQVTDKKLPPDDITDQKVDVTDTRLTKDDTTTTTTTPTTTTVTPPVTKTTPPTGGGPVTKTTAYKPWTPIPEAQAQQPFRPGLADVFYGKGALEFGPGAAAMADVADFQGRKAQARRSMELALDAAGGENQADDAYERLMSLAKESPAATVEELMNIIGRG
jgi:hypothetical protein